MCVLLGCSQVFDPEVTFCISGTALYVYNDAVFTAEDWNGIQEIARSRKREDPLKVGRFGIGFNSVYHITGGGFLQMQNIMCRMIPNFYCFHLVEFQVLRNYDIFL